MRPVLSVAQTRAIEEGYDVAALVRKAGHAVAVRTAALLGGAYGREVVVLAGRGNNGADALVAGEVLARRGARVTVWRGEGEQPPADAVVDGWVGIGFKPGRPVPRVSAPLVVSVDVPSGVDADTGETAPDAVRADVTVTFSALKPGLLLSGNPGLVEVVDIGLPLPPVATAVLDADDVAALLPRPPRDAHKYRRGVVGVVAGSERFPGAAVLACAGALRMGAGMVRLYAPRAVADLVRSVHPEVVATDGRVDAWVVGPGLGEPPATMPDGPAVVDADAITKDVHGPVLVTPHTGEWTRLSGEPPTLENVRRLARERDVTVLLKGPATIVAAPDGSTRINPTGTPLLATAGTGDVLAGACGALLAAGLSPLDAGAAGAWLHGLAARLAGPGPITASDVAEALPHAVASARDT